MHLRFEKTSLLIAVMLAWYPVRAQEYDSSTSVMTDAPMVADTVIPTPKTEMNNEAESTGVSEHSADGNMHSGNDGQSLPQDTASGGAPSTPEVDTAVVTGAPPVPKSGSESQKSDSGTAAESEMQSLDRMVVSATRTRRRISETPASVSVIARQEIDRSPAKDINDLIANKTGVQVRRFVGMGEGVPSDISMRGIPGALAATRTLILVDGIPTNASGTPFLILNEIPVEIIDNIEIVRGPYSSLYGANAFGGVINVVTKKGDGRPGAAGTFETSYPFNVASLKFDGMRARDAADKGAQQALWNGDLMSSGGGEHWHYLVNGGYRTIGNYFLTDSALVKKSGDISYHIPNRNYDYNDLRLFGKIGYRAGSRLSIDLHTRYFRSDLGFGYTRYIPDTTIDINITGEKIIIGPQVRYRLNDMVDLKAGGYVRQVIGSYVNEMAGKPVSWLSNAHDWQIDLQGIFRPIGHHVVTAGMELLSNRIEFGDIINERNDSILEPGKTARITNTGAYLQDEWEIGTRLRLVPGVRIDHHSVFHNAVSPKLGVSLTASDEVHVRASFGRAFRAPNHTELYMPPLPLKDEITIRSNPGLTPEYIWAADAGVDVLPLANLKLQGGLFYNNMKDLIGQGVEWGDTVYITHKNISRAWSAGIEFEGEWQLVRWLSLRGSYVFQQSRNESESENKRIFKEKIGRFVEIDETDIKLDYVPTNKGSFGISLTRRIGPVFYSLTADELLVGKRMYLNFNEVSLDVGKVMILDNVVRVNPPVEKLPLYARTDVNLRGDIGEHFFVTIGLQNCFDARYEESFGTYAPGRLATLRGGVTF
ncbi:MAG: TonB-dependent receptor [Chitinispirillaceae bacterium]|nr:TonB-dependent receptor [Chitinispirillaceae bacterium]